MLSRRLFMSGLGGALAFAPVSGLAAGGSLTDERWWAWLDALRATQSQVRRRGWTLVQLSVDPPAADVDLARVEREHGVAFPAQLRELLTGRSARVGFGWAIPVVLRPLPGLDLPTSGGLGDELWSLGHIADEALEAFAALKRDASTQPDGEQPNRPEMWDHQFPLAKLDDGDMLTIDVSSPQAPQPVRYFSGDLEGLHDRIIAPDLFGFIDAYVGLGCAGGDQDDWFRFVDDRDGRALLDPAGAGGSRWRAWLGRDPGVRASDEPPPAVAAKTRADFNLLAAARDGSRWGIDAALAAGAVPDCVWGTAPDPGGLYDVYDTALILALRHRDLDAVQTLLGAGAPIDTRLLSVSEAIRTGTVEIVRWLLDRGARADGWTGERLWPLHVLLTLPSEDRQSGDGATIPILEALLAAGAAPDARWDGGRTMLMWCGAGPIRVLLEHGADPKLYDDDGDTALHLARSAEAVRLLAGHGGDVNALTRSPVRASGSVRAPSRTPYQSKLEFTAEGDDRAAILAALVAAGADPLRRDGAGRSSLWYCRTVADARGLMALGLDPRERDAGGATLLFEIVRWFGEVFAQDTDAVALIAFYLGDGVEIDAADRDGTTILHLVAQRGGTDEVAFLLRHGADRSLRDGRGRRPVDLVPAEKPEVRAMLAP